jgi:hypothetical protein
VIDQVLHRTNARNDLRRIECTDVDDLRHVKVEREAVFGTHGDRLQFFVVMVCFGSRCPVQHNICGGHELDFHHTRIDRVLARIERRNPHPFVTDIHQIAMFEFGAAHIHMRLPYIGDDDTDIADRNLHHWDLFHLDEPWVQVPCAGEEDLLLQPATAATVKKRLRILEVVVTGNHRPGNFAGLNGRTVECGDDADPVWLDVMQLQILREHPVLFCCGGGDHKEQRCVYTVRAGSEDAKLPSFFASIHKEFARVLEIIAIHNGSENSLGRNWSAIRSDHEGDLALRHHGDRHFYHPVLPGPIAKVQPGRERASLVTGFTGQRHEPARLQSKRAKTFHHDPDLAFGNQDRTKGHRHDNKQDQDNRHWNHPQHNVLRWGCALGVVFHHACMRNAF